MSKALDELKATLRGQCMVEQIVQLRPYTMVRLWHRGWIGVGFAKVQWKDRWDPEYGIELATMKAEEHIARQILGLEERYSERMIPPSMDRRGWGPGNPLSSDQWPIPISAAMIGDKNSTEAKRKGSE